MKLRYKVLSAVFAGIILTCPIIGSVQALESFQAPEMPAGTDERAGKAIPPKERVIVSLGDSWSAGETAFPALLELNGEKLSEGVSLFSAAAADADIDDVYENQLGIFDSTEAEISYVTLTIGIRDSGIGEILDRLSSEKKISDKELEPMLEKALETIDSGDFEKSIKQVCCDISDTAGPESSLILADYPELFSKNGFDGSCQVTEEQAEAINSAISRLNEKLGTVAELCRNEDFNVYFVDSASKFVNHELGSKLTYINDADNEAAFLPNEAGTASFARSVQWQIDILEQKNAGSVISYSITALKIGLSLLGAILIVGAISYRRSKKNRKAAAKSI